MRLSPIALVIALLSTPSLLDAGTKKQARPKPKPRPAKVARAAKPAPAGVHVVRKQETAAKVAKAYGLSVDTLADLNPNVNLARLSPGMRLRVAGEPAARTQEETAVALAPARPLPRVPSLQLIPLPHLERVLPTQVMLLSPGAQFSSLPPGATAVATPQELAGYLKPVLSGVPNPSESLAPEGMPFWFEPADPNHLDLLWPVETRTISSSWGPRIRSRVAVVKAASKKGKKRIKVRYRGNHRGVDLNAPTGTDVYAALDGRVVYAGRHKDYGNYVVIDHGNGVETLYGHNHLNFVREGDVVRRGQKIAEVGRTGRATGPHVHFELRVSGAHRNPEPFLNDVELIPAELMAMNQSLVAPRRR